jgi:hypothetical protein
MISRSKDYIILRGETNSVKLLMSSFINSFYDPATQAERIKIRIIVTVSVAAGFALLILLLVVYVRNKKREYSLDIQDMTMSMMGHSEANDDFSQGLSTSLVKKLTMTEAV